MSCEGEVRARKRTNPVECYARRVAHQQSREPMQTIMAPCQKENDSGALSSTAASADDSTGVKYEPTAMMVTFPCKIPTFRAA